MSYLKDQSKSITTSDLRRTEALFSKVTTKLNNEKNTIFSVPN